MREREGDLSGAVALYMKAGLPGKAAKLITQHQVFENYHLSPSLSLTHTHTLSHSISPSLRSY